MSFIRVLDELCYMEILASSKGLTVFPFHPRPIIIELHSHRRLTPQETVMKWRSRALMTGLAFLLMSVHGGIS